MMGRRVRTRGTAAVLGTALVLGGASFVMTQTEPGVASAAGSAETPALFAPVATPAPAAGVTLPAPADQGAGAVVTTNQAGLEAGTERFRVQVADVDTQVGMDRVEHRAPGNYTWYGRKPESTIDNVVLTSVDGEVAGTITVPGHTYAVAPLGGGVQTITELSPEELTAANDLHRTPGEPAPGPDATTTAAPDSENGTFDHSAQDHGSGIGIGTATATAEAQLTTGTATPTATAANNPPPAMADPVTIDVLVVYQPSVATRFGTTLATRLQSAVDQTNAAFTNSQANLRFRLVHATQVAATDITDLDTLTANANIAALRNQYGADLVQGWGAYSGWCGIAWQNMNRASPTYGFSLVDDDCVSGLTPAHEWGHNIGAGHDRVNQSSAAFAYSFGLVSTVGDFSTVMAYSSSACPGGSCDRIPFYSNPALTYRGYPTGKADSEDNTRTLTNLAAMVAGYRAPVTPIPTTTTTTTSTTAPTTTTTATPTTTTTKAPATTTTAAPSTTVTTATTVTTSTTAPTTSTTKAPTTTTTAAPTTSVTTAPTTSTTTAGTGRALRNGLGRCADAPSVSLVNPPAVLATCNSAATQRWTSGADLTLRASGKCLETVAGGTTTGTQVQLAPCNGTSAQQWYPYRGVYINWRAGRCLESPAGLTADGTRLQIANCYLGLARQTWTMA